MKPDPPTLSLGLVSGMALGSYAVTTGIRMSRGEKSWRGRSHCDACGRPLGFFDTLPIVAYARYRGVSRCCHAPIDSIHLVGEVAGAAIVALSLFAGDPIRALLMAALGLVFVAAVTVDWKTQRLPNALTAAAAILCLSLALTVSLGAAMEGLIAAILVCALLTSLRWFGRRFSNEPGLGLGDVKLLCAVALWLGPAMPWVLLTASTLGMLMMSVARPTDGRLAFGPAIAAGALGVGFSQALLAWPRIV